MAPPVALLFKPDQVADTHKDVRRQINATLAWVHSHAQVHIHEDLAAQAILQRLLAKRNTHRRALLDATLAARAAKMLGECPAYAHAGMLSDTSMTGLDA